ncbi:MAG: hypothetical protein AB1758_32040 [Candidatus Eremiobacterota bacterium]
MHVQMTRILRGGLDPETERELPLRAERLRQQGRPDLADLLQREAEQVAQPFLQRQQGFPAYAARGAAILTSYYGMAAGAYVGWTCLGGGHLLPSALAAAGGAVAGLALGLPVALVTGAILRYRLQRRLDRVEEADTGQRARALERELHPPHLLSRLGGVIVCGATGLLEGPMVMVANQLAEKPPEPGLAGAAKLLYRVPALSYLGLPFGFILGLGQGWDVGVRPNLGFALGAAGAGALALHAGPQWLAMPAAMLGGTLGTCLLDPLPSVDSVRAFDLLAPPPSNFPQLFPQAVLPGDGRRDLVVRLVTGRDLTPHQTALATELLEALPSDRCEKFLIEVNRLLESGELPSDQLGAYLNQVAPAVLLEARSLPPVGGATMEDRGDRVAVGAVVVKKKGGSKPPAVPSRTLEIGLRQRLRGWLWRDPRRPA